MTFTDDPKPIKTKQDWRIGLACKPKFRTHPLFNEGSGLIIGVHPDGTLELHDPDGVIEIQWGGCMKIMAKADDWITA